MKFQEVNRGNVYRKRMGLKWVVIRCLRYSGEKPPARAGKKTRQIRANCQESGGVSHFYILFEVLIFGIHFLFQYEAHLIWPSQM